jgi:hypothetical protein
MHILFALIVLCLGLSAHASARVTLDPQNNTVTLTAMIFYSGPAATQEAAVLATNEINLYWNGATHANQSTMPMLVRIGDKDYQFRANITFEVASANDVRILLENPTPDMNFILLQRGNSHTGDRSFMESLCSNRGTWYLSDDLGRSTTAAHEFGHGFCIDHPPSTSWRGNGQPPIMAPRGELVDAEFQYDPYARPGAPGGTLNPYLRRVIQYDLDQIPFNFIPYDDYGVGYLKESTFGQINGRMKSHRVY